MKELHLSHQIIVECGLHKVLCTTPLVLCAAPHFQPFVFREGVGAGRENISVFHVSMCALGKAQTRIVCWKWLEVILVGVAELLKTKIKAV